MTTSRPPTSLPRAARILLVELAEDGSTGGSHRALMDLAGHLDPEQYRPVVVFHQPNPYVGELGGRGIEVHVLGSRSYPASLHPSRIDRFGRKVSVARQRIRFLRQVAVDLVHLNNSPYGGYDDWLPAARWTGVPCLTHARGFPWAGASWFGRRLARRFDRVITISDSIDRAWAAVGIPESRLNRIPDGVDIARLRAAVRRTASAVRAELGLGPEQVMVTMVGHLRSWKGQGVLIEALAQLKRQGLDRLHAVFVGGPTNSEDESYIRRLHDLVRSADLATATTFLGPRRDAPDYMNAADVVVHASTEPEPFGLVVLEGMALGKPVIASSLGGPAEVIEPGSGLLFDPGYPDELAGLLQALAADPAYRSRLGARGRERVERFDISRNVLAVQGVYRELLRRTPP